MEISNFGTLHGKEKCFGLLKGPLSTNKAYALVIISSVGITLHIGL